MRILIAAVLGAIVLFGWGFVAHTILPIGEMGIVQPKNEDVALEAIKTGLPAPGIYMLRDAIDTFPADIAFSTIIEYRKTVAHDPSTVPERLRDYIPPGK